MIMKRAILSFICVFMLLVSNASAAAPDIFVWPLSINFGDVQVGKQVTHKYFTVFNKGDADLVITGVDLQRDNPLSNPINLTQFRLTTDCLDGPVPAGGSCSVNMTFAPTIAGKKTALVQIVSNDPDEAVTSRPLFGNGITARISVSPGSINFGCVEVNDVRYGTVYIRNLGTAPVHVSSVSLTGNTVDFAYFPDWYAACGDLAPNASCSLAVRLHPQSVGTKSATLKINSDAGSASTLLYGQGATSCSFGSPTP
jgi:hypothetical protein